jgi:hypothetical protein
MSGRIYDDNIKMHFREICFINSSGHCKMVGFCEHSNGLWISLALSGRLLGSTDVGGNHFGWTECVSLSAS